MKLQISTPFYEVKAYTPYLVSLLNSVQVLMGAGVEFVFADLCGDSYVDRAKNTICARFLESDCTDLMMIDSDMSWDIQAIGRMITAPYELVGAAYPVKNNWEHYGCLINHDPNPPYHPIVDPATGLISAAWMPGGFWRIKRSCLEKMREALKDEWYQDYSADNHNKGRKYYPFFECVRENHQRYGEDVTFCRRWAAIGGDLWIEPRITFGHYGVKEWAGNYHEFLLRQPGGSLDTHEQDEITPIDIETLGTKLEKLGEEVI